MPDEMTRPIERHGRPCAGHPDSRAQCLLERDTRDKPVYDGSGFWKTDRAKWRRLILAICLALAPAVEANAYTAYVSNEKGNTISVIDTAAWKVVDTIKVGQRPRGIALTKDQKYVMVAVGDDDTITYF
jgi:YVTN family beta-propeller protein